jgi:hypothetical protein
MTSDPASPSAAPLSALAAEAEKMIASVKNLYTRAGYAARLTGHPGPVSTRTAQVFDPAGGYRGTSGLSGKKGTLSGTGCSS